LKGGASGAPLHKTLHSQNVAIAVKTFSLGRQKSAVNGQVSM
jgi:hypothetical protein